METIGIIAGNGRFPIHTAREAKRRGLRVVVAGLEKEADPTIQQFADAYATVKIGQLRRLRDFFRREAVSRAIMAGKIEKVRLFQENVRPDLDMLKTVLSLRDFRDDSLLGGIAAYLEREGITLLDSTLYCREFMPGAGVLGRKRPSSVMQEDIRFGFRMAKAIAGLDIGQTVVVKKKAVLAVEAIEGTDEAVRRGGALGRSGAVVVKVAKPNQDMRFDVPGAGLKTLERLIEIRAAAFAFEAGKTLMLDREEFIKSADRHGIAVVGCEENS